MVTVGKLDNHILPDDGQTPPLMQTEVKATSEPIKQLLMKLWNVKDVLHKTTLASRILLECTTFLWTVKVKILERPPIWKQVLMPVLA